MLNSIERKSKINSLVRSCRVIEKLNKNRPDVSQSELLNYRMMTSYFTRVMNAKEEGKPLALHTVFLPAEILYAMDIVPMHAETTSWMTAIFTEGCADVLAESARLGLASEICSAHRGLAGAYGLKALPRPDVVLWSSLMCDNTAKSGELLMEMNHCPGFFLDDPFEPTQNEMSYLVNELKDMIAFLEKQTGHRMDWDKLSGIVATMDRQISLTREINELRKSVPSPFPPQRFFDLLMNHYLFPGQPEAVEFLETLKAEMTLKAAEGKGVCERERFRLMTLLVPPMFALGFLGSLPGQYGAVSVVEPLFSLWNEARLDPQKPLESVARKIFMFPEMCMYGHMDDRVVKATASVASEYKVDGAICYAHLGCRQGNGVIKVFKEVLNKIDVPMLTVDCDILDPTVASVEDMRSRLEQFFELLEDR
ncbi:MAG: 2-hydroxyacyl-CoA dehydratase [Dehalococcoidales bacterium]|nr:2-hydroxyacyl-CoA dehydratase [Dehalococcoidales bacterium]